MRKPQRMVTGRESFWQREGWQRRRPEAGMPDVLGKQQGGQHSCREPKGRGGQCDPRGHQAGLVLGPVCNERTLAFFISSDMETIREYCQEGHVLTLCGICGTSGGLLSLRTADSWVGKPHQCSCQANLASAGAVGSLASLLLDIMW